MKFLLVSAIFVLLNSGVAFAKPSLTYAQAKERCSKVPQEKRLKIPTCQKVASFEEKKKNADPILGIEPLNPPRSAYAMYLTVGVMGNMQGFDGEVEKQWEHFGLGGFFQKLTIKADFNGGGELTGSAMGLSARLRFFPQWVTLKKSRMNFGIFSYLGIASLESSLQGTLPEYLYWGGGIDVSYPIARFSSGANIHAYFKSSINYIYHEDSMFLHLGNMTNIGLKLDF